MISNDTQETMTKHRRYCEKKVKESMQKIGTGICLKNTSKKIKKYGREYRENMSEEDKQKKRKNTLKNT